MEIEYAVLAACANRTIVSATPPRVDINILGLFDRIYILTLRGLDLIQ